MSQSIVNRIRRRIRKQWFAPRAISALCHHSDDDIRTMGEVLRDHRAGRVTAEEQQWFVQIEKLRAELQSSQECVEIPDFGAGSPDSGPRTSSTAVMTTEVIADACRNYSKSPAWAALLFHLTRRMRPEKCIELGTCLGISAAYQGAALQMNGTGILVTLEGAPSFASRAMQNLQSLGLNDRVRVVSGPFHDTLAGVLNEGSVDYAYIDGHHDEEATVKYFDQFLPHLSHRATLVFDDIAWSAGMARAWDRIRRHPRVGASFGLQEIGICLMGTGSKVTKDLVLL
jgi:predicted O-methyltransferase YrrM